HVCHINGASTAAFAVRCVSVFIAKLTIIAFFSAPCPYGSLESPSSACDEMHACAEPYFCAAGRCCTFVAVKNDEIAESTRFSTMNTTMSTTTTTDSPPFSDDGRANRRRCADGRFAINRQCSVNNNNERSNLPCPNGYYCN